MSSLAGFFTSITHIAAITLNVTGTPESWTTTYMIVFGLGLFNGNILGGRLADINLMRLVLGSLTVLTLTLVVFWLAAGNVVVFAAVFVMAATGFATMSPSSNWSWNALSLDRRRSRFVDGSVR